MSASLAVQNYGVGHLRKAAAELVSLKSRLARHKDQALMTTRILLHGGITIAGAGAGGFITGRFPDKTILGLKPDTAAGGALGALALFFLFTGEEEMGASVGAGAVGLLSCAATRFGAVQGVKMRSGGAPVSGTELYGALPSNVVPMRGLSPAERIATEQAQAYVHQPR